MNLDLHSISEKKAGKKWQKLFQKHWPSYKTWFLSSENAESPNLEVCRERLKEFMPEYYPTYLKLCKLAGEDPVAHRFLTGYQPPAYISGCAQVVHEKEVQLVRNYDFDPNLSEGTLLLSKWNDRWVIGMGDCLSGILDGMNSDGLVVSLTFGGREVVGKGFGIPFILRYVLEFCSTIEKAIEVLQRIPSHMSYNIMLMNKVGEHCLIQIAPDHAAYISDLSASTNHQGEIDWPAQALFTKTIERELYLHEMLAQGNQTGDQIVDEFLKAPLYNRKYSLGFGTIYTSVYRPKEGALELRWPGIKLRQTFNNFQEGVTSIVYEETLTLSTNPVIKQSQLQIDYDAAVEAYWIEYGLSWTGSEKVEKHNFVNSLNKHLMKGLSNRIEELLKQMKNVLAAKESMSQKKKSGKKDKATSKKS